MNRRCPPKSKRNMFSFGICAVLVAGVWVANAPAADAEPAKQPAPEFTAKYVAKPPALTGHMDDPAWKTAAPTSAFVAPFPPGDTSVAGKPEYATTARVLWDEKNIYVAFECRQPGPIFSTMQNHDDKLYEQDVAEVFMDVGTDNTQYAELQASPKGITGDYYHRWSPAPTFPADKLDWAQMKNHQTKIEWDLKGFRAAASVLEEDGKQAGWIVEMAIPMEEILVMRELPGQLNAGQTFRANFIRYIWLPGAKPEDKRLHRQLSWSPVVTGCPHVSPMAMKTILCSK